MSAMGVAPLQPPPSLLPLLDPPPLADPPLLAPPSPAVIPPPLEEELHPSDMSAAERPIVRDKVVRIKLMGKPRFPWEEARMLPLRLGWWCTLHIARLSSRGESPLADGA